jgi:hypothetical protein
VQCHPNFIIIARDSWREHQYLSERQAAGLRACGGRPSCLFMNQSINYFFRRSRSKFLNILGAPYVTFTITFHYHLKLFSYLFVVDLPNNIKFSASQIIIYFLPINQRPVRRVIQNSLVFRCRNSSHDPATITWHICGLGLIFDFDFNFESQ